MPKTVASQPRSTLQIYENATAELGEDKDLRAVTKVKQFIRLGIGFHHGGLIPLVKELIEILFQVRSSCVSPGMYASCGRRRTFGDRLAQIACRRTDTCSTDALSWPSVHACTISRP